MLVLLDIDGTLLHGPPRAHTEALVRAMGDVHGVTASTSDVISIAPAGRTDREIARLVLRRHGLADGDIDAAMGDWMARAAEVYPDIDAVHPPPLVAPGADAAIARIAAAGGVPALLTGNLEPIGRAKMARAGLAGWFPEGGGAFGSDHESRDALVPLARSRGGAEGAAAVVVGDTPRDVACARAGGARCVAVATGAHRPGELAGADAVVADLAAVAAILEAWLAG